MAVRDWRLYARPAQLEPGTPGASESRADWYVWLCQAGRGFGKTRTVLEGARARIDAGIWHSCNVVGRTLHDVVDTLVLGTAAAPGLLSLWPDHRRPTHHVQKRRLVTWNGAVIRYFGADEPESLRGPQADGGVADEVDAWKRTVYRDTWSNFELGIRLGVDPRIFVGTTPKRGRLVAELRTRPDCIVTRGSTYDNEANLAPQFFASIVSRVAGTHLGRQEIEGEVLDEVQGAYVSHEMIEAARVGSSPELIRVVVGVDPSGSDTGDEQGIVVKGRDPQGHGYTLADRSCRLSPEGWGRRVVDAAHEFGADCVVVETNYGGAMCEAVIRAIDPGLRIKTVTATRGKHVRFEPLALRYERGEEHHVGAYPELEEQVCGFTAGGYEGDESPGRADAAVWASLELFPVRGGLSPGDLYGEGAGA